jgi:hypothetical protein
MDTLIASLTEGLDLQTYMCEKHGWDDNTWLEYSSLYKGYLSEDNVVGIQTNKPKLLYKDNEIIAIINGKHTVEEILDTISDYLVKNNIVIFARTSTFLMYELSAGHYMQYTVRCPNLNVIGHGEFHHNIEQTIKL